MRTYFLLLAGLILLVFTACQSDELVNGGRNGEVAASFSVQLPAILLSPALPVTVCR